MSFKAQVKVSNDAKWYDNALRFETEAEAVAYAQDLHSRWMSTESYRAVPCDEPANSVFINNQVRPYELWKSSDRDLDSIEEGSD